MTHYEKRILGALLDSYEKSLLSRGENKVTIRISFPFTKETIPEYFRDDSMAYEEIHACLEELEQEGLIEIQWRNGKRGHIIRKVLLDTDHLSRVYARLGRTPKEEYVRRQMNLLSRLEKECHSPVALRLNNYLRERIAAGKSVKEFIDLSRSELTERLIRAVSAVEENENPCYIREFSIRHFGDSKIFESMMPMVKKVFCRFDDRFVHADAKEIFAEYGIYHTPDYVYLKGEGELEIGKESAFVISLSGLLQGVGISGEDLEMLRLRADSRIKKVITIENLTTFFRWREPESLILYLGGYHNQTRRTLLRKVYDCFPEAEYLHFGDIDVGGFEILEDLRSKSRIPFRPYRMGTEELRSGEKFVRKLTENDKKRLDVLIEKMSRGSCVYLETLNYMKEKGVKLEQEYIRWDPENEVAQYASGTK